MATGDLTVLQDDVRVAGATDHERPLERNLASRSRTFHDLQREPLGHHDVRI
jgi:hypothetical protein